MNRRTFVKTSGLAAAGSISILHGLYAQSTDPVYGHNGMQYRLDTKWAKADPLKNPVNDCHEMVQDPAGKILLLTNETKNNVMVFDTSGKLLETWGHEFPGAHGLTLSGDDTLFITDTVKHQVYNVTRKGRILLTLSAPREGDLYKNPEQFVPTEVAVMPKGDFYVADGYGLQYILHYDESGNLLRYFGGRGLGKDKLDNAHGICVDTRSGSPTLLVTDRTRTCFKRFSLDGKLLEVIQLPGACVCRPVIHGDHLYAAVLRSPSLETERTGFVTILDKSNKVVSNLGGTAPQYTNGILQSMAQETPILVHPHDVCIDRDQNIYVAQWASGKVYPYKFNRV